MVNDLEVTYDGCDFVILDVKHALQGINPTTARKILRISNPNDAEVHLNVAAGIVISSSFPFDAAKRWKLMHPLKLLMIELNDDTDTFLNGLWKQSGNFIDIILAKHPKRLDNEPMDIPTVPLHKVARQLPGDNHRSIFRTQNGISYIGKTKLQLQPQPNPNTNTKSLKPAAIPYWAWALVAVGILAFASLMICLIIAYTKRKHKQQQNGWVRDTGDVKP